MTGEYEAAFWDVGGVILDLPSVRRARRAFVADLAGRYDRDVEAALAEYRETLGAHFAAREGTEYGSASEGYARAVAAVAGEPVPEAEWRPLMLAASERELDPVAGAPGAVERLADAGVALAVVSDIDTWEAERILDWFGVEDCFDAVVTSEAVGRRKPDPAMFRAAIDATGCDPARTVMVGDRYEHDMEGGTRAGLTTIAVDGSAAERAPDPGDGDRVEDPAVDFVVDSPADVPRILGVE